MNSAQVDFDIIAEIEDQRRRNFRVKIVREALAGLQLNHRRPFVRPFMPPCGIHFRSKGAILCAVCCCGIYREPAVIQTTAPR